MRDPTHLNLREALTALALLAMFTSIFTALLLAQPLLIVPAAVILFTMLVAKGFILIGIWF